MTPDIDFGKMSRSVTTGTFVLLFGAMATSGEEGAVGNVGRGQGASLDKPQTVAGLTGGGDLARETEEEPREALLGAALQSAGCDESATGGVAGGAEFSSKKSTSGSAAADVAHHSSEAMRCLFQKLFPIKEVWMSVGERMGGQGGKKKQVPKQPEGPPSLMAFVEERQPEPFEGAGPEEEKPDGA